MLSVSESSTTEAASGRTTALTVVSWVVPVTLLAWLYRPVFAALVDSWSASAQTYSYGFLIPCVSAALIWLRRDQLAALPVRPSLALGIPVTALGLGMLFAGQVATLSILQELSLVVTLCGLVLLLFGGRIAHALAFPIGYLVAMIPIWDAFTVRIHPFFQNFSASIGMFILQTFSIPAIRRGLFIDLPTVTLEVAKECSGVNNLIAVLCVGIPMVHLYVRHWWKKAFILSVAVIIAIISNGIRVGTVGIFAYYDIRGENGDIHGPYSLLRSLFVSGMGFLALFWLISRFGDDWTTSPPDRTSQWRPALRRLQPGSVVIAVTMLIGATTLVASHQVKEVRLDADLGTFPHQIGQWQSTGSEAASSFDSLNFDSKISRAYSSNGTQVLLFIGHYQQQRADRELADSRMRQSLSIAEPSTIWLNENDAYRDGVTRESDEPQYVAYWYVLHDRIVGRDYQVKWLTAWNSLVHHANEGALVVVRAPMPRHESIAAARTRVRDFVDGTIDAFRLYDPN